jgi:hypothetical protein
MTVWAPIPQSCLRDQPRRSPQIESFTVGTVPVDRVNQHSNCNEVIAEKDGIFEQGIGVEWGLELISNESL